jgi:hypothetical protein
MEFADAGAEDRNGLAAQLDAAEAAADEMLEAFFRDGTTVWGAGDFLEALASWTAMTMEGLQAPARLMAQVLAFLEDDDRNSWVIEGNWADIWQRCGQPGRPPDHNPLLNARSWRHRRDRRHLPVRH